MKTFSVVLLIALGIIAVSSAHAADQWTVRRASMSGACHVGKETQSPALGTVLSTSPDAKSACDDAKSRKAKSDSEAADKSKCLSYTNGTVDLCKKAAITL
jgi:hypothetical protein